MVRIPKAADFSSGTSPLCRNTTLAVQRYGSAGDLSGAEQGDGCRDVVGEIEGGLGGIDRDGGRGAAEVEGISAERDGGVGGWRCGAAELEGAELLAGEVV